MKIILIAIGLALLFSIRNIIGLIVNFVEWRERKRFLNDKTGIKGGSKMKKFLTVFRTKKVFLVVLLALMATPCFASDWSVDGKAGVYLPIDKELQGGYSAQVDVNWKAFYVFGQYLETQRRIAGQLAGKTNILGFGMGMKIPVGDYIRVWGQMGYYLPTTDLAINGKYDESKCLQWRKWGTEHSYNVDGYSAAYNYKIQGNVGGALGIDLLYPISEHTTVGFSTGYQALKFHETYVAKSAGWTSDSGWLQSVNDKNYSGVTFGFEVKISF